jgi:hypothetical protein
MLIWSTAHQTRFAHYKRSVIGQGEPQTICNVGFGSATKTDTQLPEHLELCPRCKKAVG